MRNGLVLGMMLCAAGCAASRAAPAESLSASGARPGLGTQWGETRVSPVHEVPFERAGGQPFAVATLYYDDAPGVQAMAARDAWDGRADALAPVDGGLSVAVVDD